MEVTKIIVNKAHIKKVRYKNDVVIIYLKDDIFVCEKDSERELKNNLVEYTLKGKSDGNGRV
jgi:hypothetical protein